eukprot:COSAG05_NODE_9751_length_603_cov_5.200855_1_plen_75_part_00
MRKKADAFLDRSVGRAWMRPFVQGISLVLFTLLTNHILSCWIYWMGHPIHDPRDGEGYLHCLFTYIFNCAHMHG